MRLSGELVTPERPLSEREGNRIAQFGVATLSAAALAIASGCVTPKAKIDGPVPATAMPPANADGANGAQKSGSGTKAVASDDEIVLLTGFIVCDPPKPTKMHGPHAK